MQIKDRDGKVLFEDDVKTARETVEAAVKSRSVFRYLQLPGADLVGASLGEAQGLGANLRFAHLRDADLCGADLREIGSQPRGSLECGPSGCGCQFGDVT